MQHSKGSMENRIYGASSRVADSFDGDRRAIMLHHVLAHAIMV